MGHRSDYVLFGGAVLQGWRMCGPGRFDLVDGVLESRGGMGLLWYAERQFADFVLTVDWRVARSEDNSGVFLRFPDPGDDPWSAVRDGYEVQIHDAGARPEERTGAIYRRAAPQVDPPLNPPGEWNRLEVRVRGQQYQVAVNDREVTSFRGEKGLSGYIGLQNHDEASRVRFRDVRILDESI
jgi:hypothetical protein